MPRTDRTSLLLLAVLWLAASALVDPLGGFALNDDWVYAQAARAILQTGRFALSMPATANVYAQAWWGALFCLPLGFSFTALRASTLVLAVAGVWALYLLAREAGGGRRVALLAAATLSVNPLYFGLAHSFMTDVPFLALALIATWLYVRGLRRAQGWCLAGGILLAFAALLIRQFGVLLLLAFAVGYLMRHGAGWRALAVALVPLAGGVALQLAFQHWLAATGRTPLVVLAGVQDLLPAGKMSVLHHLPVRLVAALPYIGCFVAPFLLGTTAGLFRAMSPVGRRVAGLATLALAAGALRAVALTGIWLPSFGNVLMPTGLGPLTVRDMYLLGRNQPALPHWLDVLWSVLTVAGTLGSALALVLALAALGRVLRGLWQPDRRRTLWLPALLLTLGGGYVAMLVLLGLAAGLFDRYLLLFVPVVCVLAIGQGATVSRPIVSRAIVSRAIVSRAIVSRAIVSRAGGALALAALLLAGGFSVAATHDYLAWNRARWTATRALTDAGISPHRIDGGYEFNGWHLATPDYRATPEKSYWWVDGDDYVIAAGPLDGYREVRRWPFRRWLLGTRDAVVVLERGNFVPPQ